MTQTTETTEYGELFFLLEECGRSLIGYCVADDNGPVTNSRGFVEVCNPLQVSIKIMQNPQTGEVGPSVDMLPINLVDWVDRTYVKLSSYYPCKGQLGSVYSETWLKYHSAVSRADSLIQPAREISKADLDAAAALQRMRLIK